ncbi:MAG: hypothetical protein IT385_26480 [Deltaproteobacteria bacterium]|nr:hypothetical protein [Deltaproteobacteria bacterium]
MGTESNAAATDRMIDRLLRLAFDEERDDRCCAEGDIDRYFAGDRSAAVLSRLSAHTAHCAECLGARADFDALDASASSPSEPSRRVTPTRRSPRRPVSLALAAAAVAAIAAGVVVHRAEGPAEVVDEPLRSKGATADASMAPPSRTTDALAIAVSRDGMQFRAASGARLLSGDRIKLFYSSDAQGFLVVVATTEALQSTLLAPLRGDGAIAPGTDLPLEGGALVGEGRGCEWIVGAFSDTPLAHASLFEAISAPRSIDRDRCRLEVDVPGARNVVVIPIRR